MALAVAQLATTSPALLQHLMRLESNSFTTSLIPTSFPMVYLWRHSLVMWAHCHLELLLP